MPNFFCTLPFSQPSWNTDCVVCSGRVATLFVDGYRGLRGMLRESARRRAPVAPELRERDDLHPQGAAGRPGRRGDDDGRLVERRQRGAFWEGRCTVGARRPIAERSWVGSVTRLRSVANGWIFVCVVYSRELSCRKAAVLPQARRNAVRYRSVIIGVTYRSRDISGFFCAE